MEELEMYEIEIGNDDYEEEYDFNATLGNSSKKAENVKKCAVESMRDCFRFKSCEEEKEMTFCSKLKDTVKILKFNVHLSNLCKNKKVAIAVQIFDATNQSTIAQKGAVLMTGDEECSKNYLEEMFLFAFPMDLCGDSGKMCVRVIANYINNEPNCECNK